MGDPGEQAVGRPLVTVSGCPPERSMTSAFRPAVLILLVWLNACRPESTADSLPSFEPTTLTTSLLFSLGAADSKESFETFFRVFSGFIDEGAIHVADGGSLEVRAYDMSGNFLRSSGGPGAGPGEFANLRWITAKADSLVVLDARAGRVSLFDAGGTFVRSFLLPVDNHGQAEWIESRNDRFLVAFGTGLDPRGLAGAARDSLVRVNINTMTYHRLAHSGIGRHIGLSQEADYAQIKPVRHHADAEGTQSARGEGASVYVIV
jgi:6-bladed beta-propeller